MKRLPALLYTLLLGLGACASAPQPPDGMEPLPRELELERAPLEETPAVRAPSRSNTAVASILLDVRSAIRQGRYHIAASQLERALRIEPANPRIWHYLARVRLNQGRYAQAANLAAKSNALSRGERELIEQNNDIIETARKAGSSN